jgi:hypothetical protein
MAPSSATKRDVLQTIARQHGHRGRLPTTRWLGQQFIEAYQEIRTEYLDSIYTVLDRDRRDAQKAAELCAVAEVTPGAVIRYWAERARDFLPYRFPTIRMLSGPAAIEEAAIVGPRRPEPERQPAFDPPAELGAFLRSRDVARQWRPQDLAVLRAVAALEINGHGCFYPRSFEPVLAPTKEFLQTRVRKHA